MIDYENNNTEIVSLGNYCLTSMILKNNGLKQRSYPFDWMVTCIDNISHCINDSYKEFLNIDNYKYLKKQSNSKKIITRNNFYYDNLLKVFPKNILTNGEHQHHNFSKVEDYDYIKRCVDRFRELNNFKKIIFVMIQPIYLKNIESDNFKIDNLYNTLTNKFPNSKIKLLVFNIKQINNSIYKEMKINDNSYVYELDSKIVKGEYGMMWYDKKGINKFIDIIKSFLS